MAMTCMKSEGIAKAQQIDIGGTWKVGRGSRCSALGLASSVAISAPLIVIRVAAGGGWGSFHTLEPQRSTPEKRQIPRRLAPALTRHSLLHLPSTCSSQGRGGPIAQTVGHTCGPTSTHASPYLYAALARVVSRFVEQQRPRHQAQAEAVATLGRSTAQ